MSGNDGSRKSSRSRKDIKYGEADDDSLLSKESNKGDKDDDDQSSNESDISGPQKKKATKKGSKGGKNKVGKSAEKSGGKSNNKHKSQNEKDGEESVKLESDDEDMKLGSVKNSKDESKGDKKKKDEKKKRDRDEDDEDEDHKSNKKKPRTSTPATPSSPSKKSAPAGPRKSLSAEQSILKELEVAMKAYKWWEAPLLDPGVKWVKLEHNGVMFPPIFKPHGVKVLYEGKPLDLDPRQEELATLYAEVPLDGPQLGDPKTAKVFNKNFFGDFKKVLDSKSHNHVKSFDKLDFTALRKHVQDQREKKKEMTKEEKEARKMGEDEKKMWHSYAVVDRHIEKLGNTMLEPPGLFRGRGEHPKTGKFKARIVPEDIQLNLGEDAVVPECPIPGHAWSEIVHKHDVTWLASWKIPLGDGRKYVYLHSGSGFKGQSDTVKYSKARELHLCIDDVRANYTEKLDARQPLEKQIAVAMWVIDRLALRVGGEKGDDEADTVGCCSLRCEHVDVSEKYKLTLDFLGKDSMRHHETYDLEDERYGEIGKKIWEAFRAFTKDKRGDKQVFDQLDPSILNDHLKLIMKGLSAKVFRTYNASILLDQELYRDEAFQGLSTQELLLKYNEANKKVAILCNHQRTVSKAVEKGLEKMEETMELYKKQLDELTEMLAKVKKGDKIKMLGDAMKDDTSTEDDKERKRKYAHLFDSKPSLDQIKKRIGQWEEKISKLELEKKLKDENKTVALGTSKINYMDPRITVAWCKRWDFPIERVFSQTIRNKHVWAMGVPPDWKFDKRQSPEVFAPPPSQSQ